MEYSCIPDEYASVRIVHEAASYCLFAAEYQGMHLLQVYSSRESRCRQEYRLFAKVAPLTTLEPVEILESEARGIIRFKYYDGCPLSSSLKNHGLLVGEFLQLSVSMANAIAAFHKAGVIHRGISPESFLVGASYDDIRVVNLAGATDLAGEYMTEAKLLEMGSDLQYISPEQTGRINRICDYRTDLYSLGILLYRMLVGFPPFSGDSPGSLIHAHLAKHPVDPLRLRAQIPEILSRIILCLLEKNADDRYQSAAGLASDLEQCRKIFESGGISALSAADFALAIDGSRKFDFLTHKMYGRAKEFETIRKLFHAVVDGGHAVLFLTGVSGVGKSSIPLEMMQEIVIEGGYFAYGKFEPISQSKAFSAFTMALNRLIMQIMGEEEAEREVWQQEIVDAFPSGLSVLKVLITNIQILTENEEPASRYEFSTEYENRLRLAFSRFIGCFEKMKQPVVLFLDDIQWADLASLRLLLYLCAEIKPAHFFVIVAYRENEVDIQHPASRIIQEIMDGSGCVREMKIQPLTEDDISSLISDSLQIKNDGSRLLAKLVYQNTEGNVFLARTLLMNLIEERVIEITPSGLCQWDPGELRARIVTGGAGSIISDHIGKLDEDLIRILSIASCLGNGFKLQELSVILEQDAHDVDTSLNTLLSHGILYFKGNRYNFMHDTIREDAYARIPVGERPPLHLKIGRLLHERGLDVEGIVDQYNLGIGCIDELEECRLVAQLNLEAASRAKEAAAYGSGMAYLNFGLQAISRCSDDASRRLQFELHFEMASNCHLDGRSQDALFSVGEALSVAGDVGEKLEAYDLEAIVHTVESRYDEAFVSARKGFALVGIDIPEVHDPSRLEEEIELSMELLQGRDAQSVIDLPELNDPVKSLIVRLFVDLAPAAWLGRPDLYAMVVAMSANYCLRNGISPFSANVFSTYGLVLATDKAQYETGYQFSVAGMRISERFDSLSEKCKSYNIMAAHVNHWVRHIREGNAICLASFEAGIESGEIQWAGYVSQWTVVNYLAQGIPLGMLRVEIESKLRFNRQKNHVLIIDTIEGCRLIVEALLQAGFPQNADDRTFIEGCLAHSSYLSLFNYLVLKSQLLYLQDNHEDALLASREAFKWASYSRGTITIADHLFYHCLIILALARAAKDSAAETKKQLNGYLEQLRDWGEHAPDNFQHKYLLVKAELDWLMGNDWDAFASYQQAADLARKGGFVHIAALACEMVCRFFHAHDMVQPAARYLRDACSHYEYWGCRARVGMLRDEFSDLLQDEEGEAVLTTTLTASSIDMDTLVGATLSLSREIDQDSLLRNLLDLAYTNAGAQRACLFLVNGDALQLQAEFDAERGSIHYPVSAHDGDQARYPLIVINYCVRSLETILIDKSSSDENFMTDPYIIKETPLSVLALPLVHLGQVLGILYLENRLIAGVFTQDRVRLLEILAAQAAISLRNATLINDLIDKEANTNRLNEELQQALEELESQNNTLLVTQKALYANEQALQESLDERGVLLKEIHHRVKNNMQIISSFLSLQSDRTGDPTARQILGTSQMRIRSMALIHEKLYKGNSFARIDINTYVEDLIKEIVETFRAPGSEIVYEMEIDNVSFSLDFLIPLGLILNELIMNSVKHAFEGIRDPRLHIVLQHENGAGVLVVRDNGIGISDPAVIKKSNSLGMILLEALVRQVKGEVSFSNDNGTVARITFPLNDEGF